MAFKEGDSFRLHAHIIPMDLPVAGSAFFIEGAQDPDNNNITLIDTDGVQFEVNGADRILEVGPDHKIRRIVNPQTIVEYTSLAESDRAILTEPVPGVIATMVSKEVASETVKLSVKLDDSEGSAAAPGTVRSEMHRATTNLQSSRCRIRQIANTESRPVHSIRTVGVYRKTRAA
jgi:hypothetical protein